MINENGQQRIFLDSETSNLTNVSDSHFVSIQNQKFQSTMGEKGQAGNSSRSFFRTATLPSKPCFAESDSAWTKYKTFWFLPCFQYQMSFDVWGIARLDRRACVANLKKTKFVSHFFSLNSIASGNYFNSECLKNTGIYAHTLCLTELFADNRRDKKYCASLMSHFQYLLLF